MSKTATKNPVLDAVKSVAARMDKMESSLTEVKEKAAQVNQPKAPYGIVGPIGRDSEPYSFAKMAAVSMGFMSPEEAKYEIDVSNRLKGLYDSFAFHRKGTASWLAPYVPGDVAHYANRQSDKDTSWANEMRLRVKGWQASQYDPNEAMARGVTREKALNTLSDTQGGVLRGFPTLGDLIDLRRNLEVFSRAGSQEIALPPNGRLTLPKQVGSTIAYYAGEATALSPTSDPKFGQLELTAKKLFIRTELTNDLLRFVTPSAEAVVRNDMAQVGRRRFDRAQLIGVENSVGVRGIVTYGRPTTPLTQWVEGQDYLIEYVASTTGANGDTLAPQDLYNVMMRINDEAIDSDNLTWVGRFDMYAALANRRWSTVAANDSQGGFLFNITREVGDRQQLAINGAKFVGSSQVPNDREKGSGNTLTLLLVGDFREWFTARFGVMEFLATNVSDNAFDNDTTKLRAIEYHDSGPRTASSFAVIDNLLIA